MRACAARAAGKRGRARTRGRADLGVRVVGPGRRGGSGPARTWSEVGDDGWALPSVRRRVDRERGLREGKRAIGPDLAQREKGM
jgi:hypothetical protein